jgi:hypothetical protein
MNDFSEFYEQYNLYLKAVAQANELNKSVVFDALAAAGLTRITVEFDGAGDSGQIDDVTAYADDVCANVPETSLTIHRAMQDAGRLGTAKASLPSALEILCYDYLTQCHDGWENNDGACGTFEFDVPNRSIHLDFNERFTDTTHHSHDL